jgi:hypothetical protein
MICISPLLSFFPNISQLIAFKHHCRPLKEYCILIININYLNKKTDTQETWCLFFDTRGMDTFLRSVHDRMSDSGIEYDTIRASDKRIVIKDIQDLYGALIQHLRKIGNDVYLTMDIYLS